MDLLEVTMTGQTGRVDVQRGILYGVRILGQDSKNRRQYTADAMQEAAPKYSGTAVYLDHPEMKNLTKPRSYRDRVGTLENCRYEQGSIRGDLRLCMGHICAKQLLDDAQHNPTACGLSHSVDAKTRREGKLLIIEKITRVLSVDIVVNPATTKGLFESRQVLSFEESRANFREALGLGDSRKYKEFVNRTRTRGGHRCP